MRAASRQFRFTAGLGGKLGTEKGKAMTHSGGKEHSIGDRGQRWEVSFFNPNTNARQVYGWTEDHAVALVMADNIEKHPSWEMPWITDRQATVLPNV